MRKFVVDVWQLPTWKMASVSLPVSCPAVHASWKGVDSWAQDCVFTPVEADACFTSDSAFHVVVNNCVVLV